VKCFQVGPSTGFEGLERVDRPDPVPGFGEVLLDVRAAALNWRDLEIVAGRFITVKPPERVPLSDGAGIVMAVGPGVSRVEPGDRVICNHFSDWVGGPWDPALYYPGDLGDNRDGFLANRAVVPAHCLSILPPAIESFEDACTLPAAGLTAWRMLFEMAHVKPSDIILTLGTGGVSVFTLQLAKLAGARVAITSSSDDKLDRMRRLGADITVNYRTHPEWDRDIMAATGGRGVDIVFDNAGPVTMRQSMACAVPGGTIFMVGRAAGRAERHPSIVNAYLKNLSIRTLSSGPRHMLDDLVRGWAQSGLKPVISHIFDFEDAIAAFRLLRTGGHVGKIVIRI
jgi:NADPH:quinone reductase-like Zn-dependent oxidoreductase